MQDLIDNALAEDLGSGDITTEAVVPVDARAEARIEQKQAGVVAGLAVAQAVFERVDPGVGLDGFLQRGGVARGRPGREIEGAAASILAAERVALNFLGRLSGVATVTASYVRAVEGTGVRIADTRKTTPGLRILERYAVRAGGGHNPS